MAKYCTNCGNALSETANFCTKCGTAVNADAVAQEESASDNTEANLATHTEETPVATSPLCEPTSSTEATPKGTPAQSNDKKGFFPELWNEIRNLLKHPKKLIPTFVLAAIWLVMPLITGFSAGANISIVRFFCTLTYANGGVLGGFFGTVGGIFGKAVFAAAVNGLVLALCAKRNPFKGFKKSIGGVFGGGFKAISPLLAGGGLGLISYWFFNITSAPQNSAVAVVAAIAAIQAIGRQNGLLFGGAFYLLKKLSKGKAPARVTVNRLMMGLSAGFAIGFGLTFLRYAWVIALAGILLLGAGIGISFIGKIGIKRTTATAALVLMLGGMLLPFVSMSAYAADLPENYLDPNSIEGFSLGGDISNVGDYDGFYLKLESVRSYLLDNALNGFLGIDTESGIADIKFAPKTLILVRNGDVPSLKLSGNCVFSEQGEKTDDLFDLSDRTYNMNYNFNVTVDFEEWDSNRALFKIDGSESIAYSVVGGGADRSDSETKSITGDLYGSNCIWSTDPGDSSKHYLHIGSNSEFRVGIVLSFRILGVRPVGKSGYLGGTVGSAEGEDGYIPYKGRLTYTSSLTNKHGQPFPDIMDFNNDGYIDYADLAIRQKLVHNPDYLDTPQGAALVVVTVITTVVGVGVGTAAGVVGSTAGTGASIGGLDLNVEFPEDEKNEKQEDLGNYITRDADGDLNVSDPATGEERLYKANGDGTYTNPLTGATYTAEELRSALESRAENADNIRQDAKDRQEWLDSERERSKELSHLGQQVAESDSLAKEQQAREDYLHQVGERHGVYSGDAEEIKETISHRMEKNEEMRDMYMEYAERMDTLTTAAEITKTTADIAADVVGTMDETGIFKDVYSAATAAAGNAGEVMAGNMTVGEAIVKTSVDASTEIIKNRSESTAAKFASNILGDATQGATEAMIEGKSAEEVLTATVEGGVKGAVNATLDCGVENVNGIADNAGKDHLTKQGEALAADLLKTAAPDVELPGKEE